MTARLKAATFIKLFIASLPAQTAQPEDEYDNGHEDNGANRDDLGRVGDGRRECLGRGVPHNAVYVPVLPYCRAHETHEAHEPCKRYSYEEERVLAPARHPPALKFSPL